MRPEQFLNTADQVGEMSGTGRENDSERFYTVLPVFLVFSEIVNGGSGCFFFNVFVSSSSNGAQTPSSPDTLPFQENGRSGFVLFFAHGERDHSWQHRSLGYNQPTADR